MSEKSLVLFIPAFILASLSYRAVARALAARERSTTAISGDQVRRFAAAALALTEVEKRYSERLETSGPVDRSALEERIAVRMSDAVAKAGLSIGTFNRIVAQARHDHLLARRISQLVRISAAGLQ